MKKRSRGWEGDNPIVNVKWYDAVRYANWASEQRSLAAAYTIDTTGGDFRVDTVGGANGYRLPTGAEWEFAARGGAAGLRDSFEYAGGNQLDRVGWYGDNSGNRAHAVADLLPNQLGLYDMSGNVWEWCWDWYDNYPTKATEPVANPYGPPEGNFRVLRGGSWNYYDFNCGPGVRDRNYPATWNDYRGFRLARH